MQYNNTSFTELNLRQVKPYITRLNQANYNCCLMIDKLHLSVCKLIAEALAITMDSEDQEATIEEITRTVDIFTQRFTHNYNEYSKGIPKSPAEKAGLAHPKSKPKPVESALAKALAEIELSLRDSR